MKLMGRRNEVWWVVSGGPKASQNKEAEVKAADKAEDKAEDKTQDKTHNKTLASATDDVKKEEA